MKITFNTTGRQGIQSQILYVHSNDPVTPIAQICLVGAIIAPKVVPYPNHIDFGTLRQGECAFREIRILDPGSYDFQVTKAASDSQFISSVT